MPQVRIRWGSEATREENHDATTPYSFQTQAELDAFMYGVDEAIGWTDYETVEFVWTEKLREITAKVAHTLADSLLELYPGLTKRDCWDSCVTLAETALENYCGDNPELEKREDELTQSD